MEIINDRSSDVVNLYRVLQHHLEEFVRQFKWQLIAREEWERLNNVPPETLTDIQRAAQFYYLQRLSFGGKVAGRTYGTATTHPPRLNLLRIEEDLSVVLRGITVRSCFREMTLRDWRGCYGASRASFY